jgi:hypothetical protein
MDREYGGPYQEEFADARGAVVRAADPQDKAAQKY